MTLTKIVTNKEVPGTNFCWHLDYIKSSQATKIKAPPIPIIAAINPTNNPIIIGVNILSYNFDFGNLILNGRPCIQ